MLTTEKGYLTSRFDRAVLLMPQELRAGLRSLSSAERADAEEIRLRVGQPVSVLSGGGEKYVGQTSVRPGHIGAMIEIITVASPYTAVDAMRSGYLTARGGFRVGLGGSLATENGSLRAYREFSSAAIRISREITGCSDGILSELADFSSLLIISPPGFGKTTLLRDIVRQVSEGNEAFELPPHRVGLCDERGEIAAMYCGRAQFDVGRRTDIIDGCPKAEAAMMLLRSMNPEVIAMDEVTASEDIAAIEHAGNCGVSILASAHAESVEELGSRPLYRRLLNTGVFKKAVFIRWDSGGRKYEAVKL